MLVAVADMNVKIYGQHVRKTELEQIAEATGAELILLKSGDGKYKEEVEVGK